MPEAAVVVVVVVGDKATKDGVERVQNEGYVGERMLGEDDLRPAGFFFDRCCCPPMPGVVLVVPPSWGGTKPSSSMMVDSKEKGGGLAMPPGSISCVVSMPK